jgi:hypothetical protein
MITQLRNQVNELREKSQRPGEQNSLKRLLRSWRMALTRST